MQTVFIVTTPMHYVLAVFSTSAAAQSFKDKIGDDCIIIEQIVQTEID